MYNYSFYLSGHAFGYWDWKVKAILYSISINSTMEKYHSMAFIWIATLEDVIPKLKSWNRLLQHGKQYHRKAFLVLTFVLWEHPVE